MSDSEVVYTVLARWVPRGAMIANCPEVVLYSGPAGAERIDAVDAMIAWARWSTCGGAVTVDTWSEGERVREQVAQCKLPERAEVRSRNAVGYPPHVCGAPMMPCDVVGVSAGEPSALYCPRCDDFVRATPDERMRANVAAKIEREASRS